MSTETLPNDALLMVPKDLKDALIAIRDAMKGDGSMPAMFHIHAKCFGNTGHVLTDDEVVPDKWMETIDKYPVVRCLVVPIGRVEP